MDQREDEQRKDRKVLWCVAVVHPGLSGPEEVVGMYEADGMPGSDGISESLSDEALAHADRSDEQDGSLPGV